MSAVILPFPAFKTYFIVSSPKSVGIVTECISDHHDTSELNNCLNDQEKLNITSCQSFFNFTWKK